MVNGPPCAVCGFTLRWLPQQSSWGCDRCQRMFPASGQGAPQQQATPQQPSWSPAPTSPQSPHAMQPHGFQPPQPQGFQPPQQQGFQRPPQPGFAPAPHQQNFQPPQQGFQPPQQQGFQPGGSQSHPPGANPYAAAPSHPPAANPYAPGGYGHPNASQPGAHPAGTNPYAPAGAPAYGQQPPYSPHPATPPPAAAVAAPGAKKSPGLVIGLAVAAVAVGVGVVAFVLMRGGDGVAGGGSRNDVVKSTLAALGDGDVDQLLRLADIQGVHDKVVDCSKATAEIPDLTQAEKDERDPKKETEKRKKEYEALVPHTKGAKIELVEILTTEPPAPTDSESDDDTDGVVKTGQQLMRGCVAKMPIRIHGAKLKLKVTPKGEATVDQEAEIQLAQIGTGFYLVTTPPISLGVASLERELNGIKDKVCACTDAACAEKLKEEFKASPRRKALKKEIKALSKPDQDKIDKIDDAIKVCERKLAGDDQLEAMEQFKDRLCACTDKVCADKVTQEMTVWSNSHKDDKLAEDDVKRASELGEEMGKCITRIYSASNPSTSGGSTGGIGATIATAGGLAEANDAPPGCSEYRDMVLKLANCPKLEQSVRQGLLDGWKSIADAWKTVRGNADPPPATIKGFEDGCRKGTDALKQMGKTLGC